MEADLRFPVGKFQRPTAPLTDAQRREFIAAIAAAPARLNDAVKGLKPAQLDTRYRPEGWTVRQVVHHVPDSHMNAYTRFKLALTEEMPLIKPYNEAKWAELGDVTTAPIEPSLALLENLHKRWVLLLGTLGAVEWSRQYRHPEHEKPLSLDDSLALYAWHGKHHVAHITSLREREGWR
jgi:DinB superfamily